MKIYTVSALNRIIKDLIDNEIVLEDVMVTGELSSFSITRNIAYFTLKDNDNLLNCVQFMARREFQIGDMVQVRGNVKYYPKGGKLSLNALSIELCGQGELYRQFIEMKNKLQAEGLFDESNKMPIPRFVNSIGVVTSSTGAVLQDIKNVTRRRNPNLDIYVYDAQVQGRLAVNDVIQGITYFDNMTDVDVIIVARGGGSLEDLAPFNNEELARVAYICNKPLISAVGHETDYSILDFVADLRAPTPSAAAELVTFDTTDLKRYIKDIVAGFNTKVASDLDLLNSSVHNAVLKIDNNINGLVNDEILYISDLYNKIDKSIETKVDNTKYMVNLALNTLDKLNPIRLLKAGYSYATIDDRPINFDNTQIGNTIKITTADALFSASILDKERK